MTQTAMSITQLCNNEEEEQQKIQLPPIEVHQPHFIRRLPLVDTALKAYENSSSVVKYGAEMIESYAVGPLYDRLGYERKFDQLDNDTMAATTALARATIHDNEPIYKTKRIEDSREDRKKPRPCSRSTSPHKPYSIQRKPRWQQIVLHAGSAAGTTAAVISEESMKCLKYCLSWLQYAVQHIEQQMTLLRQLLVSLATKSSPNNSPHEQNMTINNIKREIINTLRKAVEVVSKYAGKGLPEQAKQSVRSFILELPGKWALVSKQTLADPNTPVHVTSIRLLDFGGESIEMLKSVSVVFSETVERAELWLKRLKVVGVNPTEAN
ncbi:unnamed protein product [Rhizopus stolonifer]